VNRWKRMSSILSTERSLQMELYIVLIASFMTAGLNCSFADGLKTQIMV
jgi:hypothetical protein